jgi:predicted 2-oxoglutarate/Fe(II)-dependent dioxygenase YbiX
MELKHFIDIHENVFPEGIPKTLNKLMKDFSWTDATIYGNGNEGQKLDKRIRDVQNKCLTLDTESLTEWHWINFLGASFMQANQNYFFKRKLPNYADTILNINFLKYENSGHYNFHVDAGKDCNRTLSMIYFINDEYEGGNLVFKNIVNNEEYRVEKKQNTLVVWPSNFLFPHCVTPVTKGIRYSIVSWTV